MKKLNIIIICTIIVLSGCNVNGNINEDSLSASTPTTSMSSETVTDTISTVLPESEDNGLSEKDRHVDTIGNIKSFSTMANLNSEQKSTLSSFNIEKCYFKPINEPENMKIVHMTLSEIGFFLTYTNEKTEERYSLIWWADDTPSRYLEELNENLNRQTNSIQRQIISQNGIDYYCDIMTVVKEPSDTNEVDMPYHAEIRWIEDNKCMYICAAKLQLTIVL